MLDKLITESISQTLPVNGMNYNHLHTHHDAFLFSHILTTIVSIIIMIVFAEALLTSCQKAW